MIKKNILLAAVCKLLAVEEFVLQETPQKVTEVREYEACADEFTISVQKKAYYKIDRQKTTPDREVLWSLPRKTEETTD